MALMRLFNEQAGQDYLAKPGVPAELIAQLALLGISGICQPAVGHQDGQVVRDGPQDVVVTMLTDSMELYGRRLRELTRGAGPFTATDAAVAHAALHAGRRARTTWRS